MDELLEGVHHVIRAAVVGQIKLNQRAIVLDGGNDEKAGRGAQIVVSKAKVDKGSVCGQGCHETPCCLLAPIVVAQVQRPNGLCL